MIITKVQLPHVLTFQQGSHLLYTNLHSELFKMKTRDLKKS